MTPLYTRGALSAASRKKIHSTHTGTVADGRNTHRGAILDNILAF